ncbi:HEAT repeat domain-containing protein [Paracoccus aestuariivivens]|uniref:Alpha/beta hydrolase n=1 Tax=Paracoccus aestuariivivens TaxID=1820333 RepID=A0A6L6J9D5_9RHOB|nr:HEAT repeat domain-containing protein [Paracoccus aestuariivivens]MTH77277.1 hypothetical protein [Paracoccus aestuariivivens]
MRHPERLHGDGRHRVTLFRTPSGSAKAVVCFEPGRDLMNGFETPHCPAFAERLGVDALMVQTARRDWFLSRNNYKLANALSRATAGYNDVTGSGFSMGGYGALLFSAAARLRRVLLVSPQYNIDPDIVTYDPDRANKFRRIGYAMPCPETLGDTALRGLLIYDPTIPADRGHAACVAKAFPKLRPVTLPFGGHPATSVIGDAKKVGRLSTMLVDGKLNIRVVRRLHRDARRQSDKYRLNLVRAAVVKHPATAQTELHDLARSGTPYVRFEAGIALVGLDEPLAVRMLTQLLADVPDPPPHWAGRMQEALDHAD